LQANQTRRAALARPDEGVRAYMGRRVIRVLEVIGFKSPGLWSPRRDHQGV